MALELTTPASRRSERLERLWAESPGLVGFLTSTDHKRIGLRYLVTGFAFFVGGGIMALLLRTQLAAPEAGVLGPKAYDELMTMHGVTMIFLFATPMLSGAFGNYLVPLQIGARDMAFPRLNALSYWTYLASGIFLFTSLAAGDAPQCGWFCYAPLAERRYSPDLGTDFYSLGLVFLAISSTVGAANFVVTIARLRAPGMSLNRLPLLCWAILATSFSLLLALPALTAANVMTELDRKLGFHFFDVARGGDPVLYQHLFWIFGHPDVYIIFLPALGFVSSIVPVFARRPMVARTWLALSTVVTAFIGFGVWVHHMFAVGLPQITTVFFAAASLMVVIPSGIQVFGWSATLVGGRPLLRTPLLYVLGFLVVFVVGGLTGAMFAAIPFDQQVTDTYFVVAHFHYVLFGGAVFPLVAALHYWYPKATGRMYHERAAQATFWLFLVGFNLTFFPMHVVGLLGMPRRVYTYQEGLGLGVYNLVETVGAFLLAAAILLVVANLAWSRRRGPAAGADPWHADTLEWATSSPPPAWNFDVVPVVRSATPNWEGGRVASELVLDAGHETPATSPLDGDLDDVLEMPSESPWPFLLALALSGVFALLLLGHFVAASLLVGAGLLVVAAWHAKEPAPPRPLALPRLGWPSGLWGMACLVATEGTLFATLVASWFYLRFRAPVWPPPGTPRPALLAPLLLLGLLVATSLPLRAAARAARHGRLGAVRARLALALAAQVAYLGIQVHRLLADLDRFTPQERAYGSSYYLLVGAHHAHVAVGILLVAYLLLRLSRGLTSYRANGVRCAALYWHSVNVLALVVTGTILSARA